jgi:hypothetical protein
MADKQAVLKEAVPDLVQRLVSPNCVDPDTGVPNKAMTPKDTAAQCSGTLIREFTPIRNIHVGVITSSIGGHGSQTLCLGSETGTLKDQEENDHAWLIGKRPRFMAAAGGVAADPQGFLNWNPDVMKGETPDQFTLTFQAMTTAAGEFGCGLESQLEAISERLHQCRFRGAEVAGHEAAARLPIFVGDLHALRIVNQDAEEIPLRHHGGEHQLRSKEAEEDDRQDGPADAREHHAVLPAALAPDAGVAEGKGTEHHEAECHHAQRRPGGGEREVSLRENERPVLEEEREERFH